MAKQSIVRFSLLFLAVAPSFAATELLADDGWRRTAQGWEQKSEWAVCQAVGHVTAPRSHAPLQPVVVHPGQVALLQVAGCFLVLSLFAPTRLRTKAPH